MRKLSIPLEGDREDFPSKGRWAKQSRGTPRVPRHCLTMPVPANADESASRNDNEPLRTESSKLACYALLDYRAE